MGCLNDYLMFYHWFGNIHLSGRCNRNCYFCIGQHMPGQDMNNNLGTYPLINIDKFMKNCQEYNVKEINITGTNTDPLLYKHITKLNDYLRENISGLIFGIRTNGILAKARENELKLFDKMSLSITSLDPIIYKKTMGIGFPPNVLFIMKMKDPQYIKINTVLCPETTENSSKDLITTIDKLNKYGAKIINLREPYGQPHIGDPLSKIGWKSHNNLFGMPVYDYNGTKVTYWDVHYVEVKSVNLYADGHISKDYAVTKGHSPTHGKVQDQSFFKHSGRQQAQWIGTRFQKNPNLSIPKRSFSTQYMHKLMPAPINTSSSATRYLGGLLKKFI
jgi:organic radical activating enzyme